MGQGMMLEALAAAAIALSPAADTPTDWYGWNWDHSVSVYDGTGNPIWDVDGAVRTWSMHGLDLYMTDDPNADIVVTQGDANAACGTAASIIGCAEARVVDGEPVSGWVVMSDRYADWPTEYVSGGTRHEFCHVVGFGHPAGLTNEDSVCGVPIDINGHATMRLTQYDKEQLRLAY